MSVLLGAIADDFTGATDLANTLVKEGMRAVQVIGPAGENRVLYAGIVSNERIAGRTGVGAVMGSKNLKALVVKGSKPVEVFDLEELKALTKRIRKDIKENPDVEGFTNFGTAGFLMLLNEMGILPTNNFQKSAFDQAENKMHIHKAILEKHMLIEGSDG